MSKEVTLISPLKENGLAPSAKLKTAPHNTWAISTQKTSTCMVYGLLDWRPMSAVTHRAVVVPTSISQISTTQMS